MIIKIKKKIFIAFVICLLISSISLFSYTAIDALSDDVEVGTVVPIIMYHSILNEPKKAGKYVVSQIQLENDIKYLLEKGYTSITISDLIKYQENNDYQLPAKPVIITFDDGYFNNYVYAYPLMIKYNFKSVISIVGEYSSKNNFDEKQRANYSHLTFEQMKEMQDSGKVEIANHSFCLHQVNKSRNGSAKKKGESLVEYSKVFSEDTLKLQNMLMEKSNIKPYCYTFPFGKISNESDGLLKELGFKASLTCYEKLNYITKESDLFGLHRFNRPSGKNSKQYFENILPE